jgi:exopolyphosphatase/guanosine-5'-triphosphate,3'-diphosphate pyrophosphatase
VSPSGVERVRTAKTPLRLGAEIERAGRVSRTKLRELELAVRGHAGRARKAGTEALDVLVASPGRQAENADELVATLERTIRVPVRVLTAEEEGVLAYEGAVASLDQQPASVAVVDVGGGSTQIVVGTRTGGPAWVRSVDLGSLRLAGRVDGQRDALAEAVAAFGRLVPPLPRAALAAGGTARALGKLVGPLLGHAELARALTLLEAFPAEELGVDPARAETLPAGAAILAVVQARLDVPLRVAESGLREGAALALAREVAAA